MARYVTTIRVPVDLQTTFAYVSDFRHATWDPRVSSATRTDGNGPIGVGSRFELVSPTLFGRLRFPYQMVEYDPPRRVRLAGENWLASYVDEITFDGDGAGTLLHYDARFDLKGLLSIGEPIMRRLFQRVGDDATRGIAAAIVQVAAKR